jgi:acetate kinase
MAASVEGLDVLVFTGGVGENSAAVMPREQTVSTF